MNHLGIVRVFFCAALCLGTTALVTGQPHSSSEEANAPVTINGTQWRQTGSGSFIENKGQMTDMNGKTIPSVFFQTSSPGVDVYLRDSGLTYVFTRIITDPGNSPAKGKTATGVQTKKEWGRLDMILEGSSISRAQIVTGAPAGQGYTNYYHAHCPDGILRVNEYNELIVENVYEGIDLVLHTDQSSGIKYDFIIHPGADPGKIVMKYNGAENIQLLNNGRGLRVKTKLGEITEGNVFSFQDSKANEISSSFILESNRLRFSVGEYDHAKILTIDPPLTWATYYGGSADDFCFDVITDQQGNVFVTGTATASNFPCLDPGSGTYYQGTGIYYTHWISDAFVLKFNN
ncbi:MAG TPA: SBBP repeat-containing protein, partial [Bacteroidia bacterium]|nr:SBBP repeat-containing protein [Bacteroidia bacterium]